MNAALPIALGTLIGAAGLFATHRMMGAEAPSSPSDRSADTAWAEELALVDTSSDARYWDDRFPNVQLKTHDGRTVRFYDDLIKDKIVALNFMYVACTKF